ncbi:K+/H+ antiporter subunit F [Salinimonas chungwhensis]|uniref:K+/H+ antiporter subunit F n=1 Tax=Salinimonas chungwhensis TaxID=265425 RepID=UPI00036E75A5|nr:K+/H+ antiporter subunit F [Salinimonas chungwhensis]
MLETAVICVGIMISIALILNLWRLLVGPDLVDRIVALDTMYINSIALIMLFGMYNKTSLYFEAALLIAMLGFVSSVAFGKYILRGDIIE